MNEPDGCSVNGCYGCLTIVVILFFVFWMGFAMGAAGR